MADYRNLSIKKPPMKGEDVRLLQAAINRRAKATSSPSVAVDGVFGYGTLKAARREGYILGFDPAPKGPIVPHLQIIIRAPWRRTPAEQVRGKARYIARRTAVVRARAARLKGGYNSAAGAPGYGGSKAVLDEVDSIFRASGCYLASTKRTPAQNRAVGGSPSSDHLTSNSLSYAKDWGTYSGADEARRVARHFGASSGGVGTYQRTTVSRAGRRFSVQILWAVRGHYDHVHIGCHRV